jgi:diaminohydroxyphosphoribosylaminopyrimidine deaminase/5-amino-6-(5-phosphoribosylamino)uracil reductase
MRHALRLAERGLGRVSPNPSVGCVIVTEDELVIGRGRTADGGRPHAETVALQQAGNRALGATAYVTLEPCAHHGQTPPCAEALVEAGLRRVVVAIEDPDPRVGGRGLARLRDAGVEVISGVLIEDAARLNAGFFLKIRENRPLVTLKIAQSLDAKTATASGDSKWITGEAARAFGHLLRASHDAILIGIETAIADDPELSCRIVGLEAQSPLRVVLDTRLRLGELSALARSAERIPILIYTVAQPKPALIACGVDIVQVSRDARGRPDVGAVLNDLAGRGITRVLVEGGASVHASFLDRGYADRLEIFHAPLILGGGGHSSIEALAALTLDEAPKFDCIARRDFGIDLLESFEARA